MKKMFLTFSLLIFFPLSVIAQTQQDAQGSLNAAVSAFDANGSLYTAVLTDQTAATNYWTSIGVRFNAVVGNMPGGDVTAVFDYLSGGTGYLEGATLARLYGLDCRSTGNTYLGDADTAFMNSQWTTSMNLSYLAISCYEDYADVAFNDALSMIESANDAIWAAEIIVSQYE